MVLNVFWYEDFKNVVIFCGCELKPETKNWNKTRRYKMVVVCNLYMCKCVIHDTARGSISKLKFFMGGGWSRDMQHFETKTIWYLPSLALCEACLLTLHFSYECLDKETHLFSSIFLLRNKSSLSSHCFIFILYLHPEVIFGKISKESCFW